MTRVAFAIPGHLDAPTGGYAYDRRVIAGLRRMGHRVDVVPLGDGFPLADPATVTAALERLAGVPRDHTLLVDGLAFGVLPPRKLAALDRRLVVILHHPLALETGLDEATAERFLAAERAALGTASDIVVTSATTRDTVIERLGVEPGRIAVAPPGTTRRATSAFRTGPPRILSVGTLIPRKGQADLVAALEPLADADWRLTLVGADDRDAAYVRRLNGMISAHPAGGRITVAGAIDGDALESAYRAADIFVLPTYYEGYGMAVAEALSFGLPVVATRAGAVPEVAGRAGILVEAGDTGALSDALADLIGHPERRRAARDRSLARAAQLSTWEDTVSIVAAVIGS